MFELHAPFDMPVFRWIRLTGRTRAGAHAVIGSMVLALSTGAAIHAAPADWTERAALTAPTPEAGDTFGAEIAVDGELAAVGARGHFGTTGDEATVGSVFVYEFDGVRWRPLQELAAFEVQATENFGQSIALHGDVLVVGASGDSTLGDSTGAVFVYRRINGMFEFEQRLTASDADPLDFFGWTVALDDDTLAITAIEDEENGGLFAGSVYLFGYDGSQWVEQQKLLASDGTAGDFFGDELALDGHRLVASAPNNRFDDDPRPDTDSGAVYTFEFDGVSWSETDRLRAPGGAFSAFGRGLALRDDTLVVSAREMIAETATLDVGVIHQRLNSTWIPIQSIDAGDAIELDGDRLVTGRANGTGNTIFSGIALVYERTDDAFAPVATLAASDGRTSDGFGFEVGIDRGTLIIGATGRAGGGGAVYVYTDQLAACAGDVATPASGVIDQVDLTALLACWGPADGACADFDIRRNGAVDFDDLSDLLATWGPCNGP